MSKWIHEKQHILPAFCKKQFFLFSYSNFRENMRRYGEDYYGNILLKFWSSRFDNC